jgi:hypothetical protein
MSDIQPILDSINVDYKIKKISLDQKTTNDVKSKIIENSPQEVQEKFAAVEKAVEDLVKAGVLFYLFPSIENDKFGGEEVVWQYNSVVALSKLDSDGTMGAAERKKNSLFASGVIYSQFFAITDFFLGKEAKPKERLDFFVGYVCQCVKEYSEHLEEISPKKEKI